MAPGTTITSSAATATASASAYTPTNITSIIVAVIALVASIATACLSTWVAWRNRVQTRHIEKQKNDLMERIEKEKNDLTERIENKKIDLTQRTEEDKIALDKAKWMKEGDDLFAKYRNPLLLASIDLQSRLWNMFQGSILDTYRDSKPGVHNEGEGNGRRKHILTHTMFLIGQYLSWTHIMKRQIQILRFSTVKDGKSVFRTLEEIQNVLSTSEYDKKKGPELFMLWRAEQEAIGEIMTDYGKGPICIMYSEFTTKFEGPKFREWFRAIEQDFDTLAKLPNQTDRHGSKGNRLWRLQHLLVDLIQSLDVWSVTNENTLKKVQGPDNKCTCSNCVYQRVLQSRTIRRSQASSTYTSFASIAPEPEQ